MPNFAIFIAQSKEKNAIAGEQKIKKARQKYASFSPK
jgi:hypothetical protein